MSLELRRDYEFFIKRFSETNKILRNLRLGTDIDGTEVDTFGGALDLINLDKGTKFTTGDLTYDFAMYDLVRENIPSVEDPKQYVFNVVHSDQNLGGANPVSGSWLVQRFLHFDGKVEAIHRITSRPGFTRGLTLSWYASRMPWVNPELIHIQENGNEINQDYKVGKVKELDLDWYWEDVPSHAEKIVNQARTSVIIVPQPWNLSYQLTPEGQKKRRIFLVPDGYCPLYPAAVRAYLRLSDILMRS